MHACGIWRCGISNLKPKDLCPGIGWTPLRWKLRECPILIVRCVSVLVFNVVVIMSAGAHLAGAAGFQVAAGTRRKHSVSDL